MKSFVVNISQFFKLDTNKDDGINFSPEKRKLLIPLYQREYKWTNEKISDLINDILKHDKFLGIIILDEHNNHYEIVDGQQRITTCYLALVCLFNLFRNHPREQKNINALIQPYKNAFILKNDSIGDYLRYTEDLLQISIQEQADVYYQKDDFERAYSRIAELLTPLEGFTKYRDFKQNLLDSQFLVLINETENSSRPVEQIFLDINEKSQLLEQADIFKGYCFKNYGNAYREELNKLWVSLKKCAVCFIQWGFKDFDEFIYTYLLLTVDSKMPSNLSPKGKHYLDGKSIDETEKILKEMISYGTAACTIHNSVCDISYCFEDITLDGKDYRGATQPDVLKQIIRDLMESKGAQYQKLPLLYLIGKLFELLKNGNGWHFSELQKVITNMYVYATLFSISGTRKSKELIDHSVFRALNKQDNKVEDVIIAAQELRRNQVSCFELAGNINKYESLSQLYSVVDFYVPENNRLNGFYRYSKDYSLEHFIIPDNRRIRIHWMQTPQKLTIELPSSCREYKKRTINYLILSKELNEQIEDFDIVYKIEKIREYYHSKTMPRHIETYIRMIEDLNEYRELKALDKETDDEIIREYYYRFVSSYFSEMSDANIRAALLKTYKESFSK